MRSPCGAVARATAGRGTLAALAACAIGFAPLPAAAQTAYRCPGNHYTNDAREAQRLGCKAIEGLPVTVPAPTARKASPAARPAAAATPTASGAAAPGASAPAQPAARIDAAAQRQRDTDARRILGDELAREEARLAQLKLEFNGGQPERRGDERNFQRYLDRVEEMRAAIARSESDVLALRRELSKLAQP